MSITLLEQRLIEARVIARMYSEMKEELGEERALGLVRRTLEKAAFEAGREFAASAPNVPSMDHFATVVSLWRGTGALDLADVRQTETTLSFRVIRCDYTDAYREEKFPEELIRTLSCCRDEPFAAGYSERIMFSRPQTLAKGDSHCDFSFEWKQD